MLAPYGVYRRNLAGPLWLAIMAALVALPVTWSLLFLIVPPIGHGPTGAVDLPGREWRHITGSWFCDLLPFGGTKLGESWHLAAWEYIAPQLAPYGLLEPFEVRISGIIVVAAVVWALTFFVNAKTSGWHRVGWRYIRGRRLREGYDGVYFAQREFRKDINRRNPSGLYLAPGVVMDIARETETFLMEGAPGSGKTQWFRYLFSQILDRSRRAAAAIEAGVPIDKLQLHPDKVILLDVKSDVTERLPDDEFMLMAPHDTGGREGPKGKYLIGVAWDVGRDILGLPAAKDLATRIISESADPVWAGAAREILTGLIVGLQLKFGKDWGWGHLRRVLEMKAKQQKAFLEQYYPVAAGYYILTRAGPTRTTASYLANINTQVYPVILALALGWCDVPPDRRLSLRDWILDPNPKKRVLVLQMSGTVQAISAAWIRGVMSFMSGFVASPELPESNKRRIWWGLDEFPQVAQEGDGFLRFVEVGRSKGFCSVIGAQVKSQFEESYSKAQLETLEAMARTQLIFRTGAGSISKYLSEEVVGFVEWRARERSTSVGTDTSRSYSTTTERELTVQPNYFQDGLGKFQTGLVVPEGGIYGLYVGARDACRLEIPFSSWGKQRLGTELAPWVFDPRTLQRSATDQDIEGLMVEEEEDEGEAPPAGAPGPGAGAFGVGFSLFTPPSNIGAGASALGRLKSQDPQLFQRLSAAAGIAGGKSAPPNEEEDE